MSSPTLRVAPETDRRLHAVVAAVIVTAAVGLGILWLVVVPTGPEACALSMPGPRNCFPSDRVSAAQVGTALVAIGAIVPVALALVVARARPRAARTIARIGLVLTSVTAGYALFTSAWIPALAFARLI
ncbi:hypothetical protein [Microbacterium aurantiacum]|uniref:Uncharacterized protein n=1 Tax=Microbacterium aurantiacum TaxID=162393 RepID=A0ABT8FSY5_9MICO|nr:hypothetical protein [Microbacterium aurantiacum]MDN4464017.1 hypothetical protein [Microbacterium aurantiacum]